MGPMGLISPIFFPLGRRPEGAELCSFSFYPLSTIHHQQSGRLFKDLTEVILFAEGEYELGEEVGGVLDVVEVDGFYDGMHAA